MTAMIYRAGLASLIVTALLLGGCSDEGTTDGEQAGTVQIDNEICPIMDSPATAAIETRQYKGYTVGFCCAGCPDAWDRLSEEQKDAHLARIMPERPEARE